jgi:2'-5' RNA ligase
MKTFRMFIEEKTLSRKYITVVYDKETQARLREWCTDANNFDLTKDYNGIDQEPSEFEFHTTILYSHNKVKLENTTIPVSGEVYPVKFKLLGENEDIPALLVSSPDLDKLRNEYEQKGLRDGWPEFLPHISLSYVRHKYDLSRLKLPEFRMKFGELKIEDINEAV